MELRAGIIIIGSLIWDQTATRKAWRTELDIAKKVLVELPIRYGRKSRQDGVRKGTYTMVFSNDVADEPGQGLVVPIKKLIMSEEELRDQVLKLSDAEGISSQTISKEWGTVSVAINPFLEDKRKNEIETMWSRVINTFINQNNYLGPIYNNFGEGNEPRSITHDLKLNTNLETLFRQCTGLEILLATSNAIRLDDGGTNRYPTPKQIAAAIYKNNYSDYFLSNRLYSIKTFEDEKIGKILKYKYRMKLKTRREFLRDEYTVYL
jgi:hypothetical protein